MKANMPEKLDGINQTLARQNEIMQKMLAIMPKPPGKVGRAADAMLTFVGISAVVNFVDVVIRWFTGG